MSMLRLYNTFKKGLNPVELSGKLLVPCPNTISPISGSLYICGPTVYSDSHLGHALTYIRADLFRRFMKSVFNVELITVMNITDIDDKILAQTFKDADNSHLSPDPHSHPFNEISEKYLRSFQEDMTTLRVKPPDLCVKVSRNIPLITNFISKLEQSGHTYTSADDGIYFNVSSVNNYVGRSDPRQQEAKNTDKKDLRDFVLWKKAKPNEPVWSYKSPIDGIISEGRPGWHVQCSAISSAIFGKQLDFHFGGKDLIFPHHYNEEACCCAFHRLDTTSSMHVWSKNWLHSGHLILKNTKMSKSIGNVIGIKNFLNHSCVNVLRLMCISNHYRTDFEYDDDELQKSKNLDHKLSSFVSFLNQSLKGIENELSPVDTNEFNNQPRCSDIEHLIQQTRDSIVEGLCEDFDLRIGLKSILDLSKVFYSLDLNRLHPKDLISTYSMLKSWCQTCGLDYKASADIRDDFLLELITTYRQNVRNWALQELKRKNQPQEDESDSLHKLLKECDSVRASVEKFGLVIRDPKIKS